MQEPDGHRSAKTDVNHRSGWIAKLAYVSQLARTVASLEAVSVPRQFAEIAYLYVTRSLGPLMYYEQALWQPQLNLRQKQNYLNQEQYLDKIDALNPPQYRKLSQHKLVEGFYPTSTDGSKTAEYSRLRLATLRRFRRL